MAAAGSVQQTHKKLIYSNSKLLIKQFWLNDVELKILNALLAGLLCF